MLWVRHALDILGPEDAIGIVITIMFLVWEKIGSVVEVSVRD